MRFGGPVEMAAEGEVYSLSERTTAELTTSQPGRGACAGAGAEDASADSAD